MSPQRRRLAPAALAVSILTTLAVVAGAHGARASSQPVDWPVCKGGPQTGSNTPSGPPTDMTIPHCRAQPTGSLPSSKLNRHTPQHLNQTPSPQGEPATVWNPQEGHYFTGVETVGGSYIGVQAAFQVVTPTFLNPNADEFYSLWNMTQDQAGENMTQGGWIDQIHNGPGCGSSGQPMVFYENENNGSYGPIECFAQYPLTVNDSYFFDTIYDFNGSWGDYIYWNGAWNLLGENQLPWQGTDANSQVETLGEGYDGNASPPQIPTANVYQDAVAFTSNYMWAAWNSDTIPTSDGEAPPYCLYSTSPWQAWETWNGSGGLHC